MHIDAYKTLKQNGKHKNEEKKTNNNNSNNKYFMIRRRKNILDCSDKCLLS